MAQLQTHDVAFLVSDEEPICPGTTVRHEADARSYGIVLSRRDGPEDLAQCEVLWSREPRGPSAGARPAAEPIPTYAVWTREDRAYSRFDQHHIQTTFAGEEVYAPDGASLAAIRAGHRAGAFDVEMHSDGHVTVHRASVPEWALPEYAKVMVSSGPPRHRYEHRGR